MLPQPYTITVPEGVLQDLQQRLEHTRTPHHDVLFFESSFGKDFGQRAAFQQNLLEHWKTKYDWRKFESELNSFPNFTLQINPETNLHFLHLRCTGSPAGGAVPLLLVHGWPGSVWEFHHLLPLLQDKFHLVVPSLPGYGWSTTKADKMNVEAVGHLFHELMLVLGYDQYVAQGGDWGSLVIREIAFHHPKHCVGMHSNMPVFIPTPTRVAWLSPILALDWLLPRRQFSQFEQEQLARTKHYVKTGAAYMLMNASKPHTLGFGLHDSPAGLLAYISEKIALWSDPKSSLSEDEILTNVMIYWVTGSITSSLRLYYESLPFGKDTPGFKSKVDRIDVPCGLALFSKEAIAFPQKWLRQTHNVVQATEFAEGGHFAAWEQPNALAKDIEKFAFVSAGGFAKACQLGKKRKQQPSKGGLTWRDMLCSKPAAIWWTLFALLFALLAKLVSDVITLA
ncbi:hypothetical protein BASA81_002482 [Batrachochytrium salamandrivorans]|nr:hypothetical protein BASA81_002482 [Batrachochytrium salamandrivorans]